MHPWLLCYITIDSQCSFKEWEVGVLCAKGQYLMNSGFKKRGFPAFGASKATTVIL